MRGERTGERDLELWYTVHTRGGSLPSGWNGRSLRQIERELGAATPAPGSRLVISGGLPAVVLEPAFPEAQFRAYANELFDVVAPGDAFVLGVADNVMPTSLMERVERRGRCPISGGR